MKPQEILTQYVQQGFRLVFWPMIGDSKGPREKGWTEKVYTLADYQEGYRVGLICGHEISPGRFFHDIDIDFGPAAQIASALLPPTEFVYGRPGKRISHCGYTLPEALPTFRYEDPSDKTCLIEIRGVKLDGQPGMQSMAPPSVWSKGTAKEPLTFVRFRAPAHIDNATALRQRVCLCAISMILAKHFGKQGFGHETRLAWAGFVLRAGLTIDECVQMGDAICLYTGNADNTDVRLAVESTHKRLEGKDKKVKGGPALAKLLGEHGKAVIKRINEWLGRDSDFIRDQDGMIIKDHQDNISRALSMLSIELSYNEFSDKLLVNKTRPLEDRELNELWLRIDEEYRFRPSFMFFEKVIKRIAWGNSFHPVRDYFATLTWDQTPRIDEWLVKSGGAIPSAYTLAVSGIFLIAAVRRVKTPGCKHDEMLVLESKQGLQKSSALRALCPNPEWFSDDFQLNHKSQQMIESTLGKWIIEAGELSGMRPAQMESLKANLSRQIDGPARMAYAHLPVERPRQFVIIGTTNADTYLADPTGARRFWPVSVGKFDVAWITEHRDQLWAEAVHREAAGESNRLPESLWPAAGKHQEQRREIDPWEGLIRNAMVMTDSLHSASDHKTRVVTTFLWDALAIPPERRDRRGSIRISEIMQRLGFVRTRLRPAGEDVQVGFVSVADHWVTAQTPEDELHEQVHALPPTSREPGEDDEDAPF